MSVKGKEAGMPSMLNGKTADFARFEKRAMERN